MINWLMSSPLFPIPETGHFLPRSHEASANHRSTVFKSILPLSKINAQLQSPATVTKQFASNQDLIDTTKS